MITLELNQVEVDHCLACKGIWLDSGELELLLGESEKSTDFLTSFQLVSGKEKVRKCPICRSKMEKIRFGSSEELIIDRCISHGLWFDQHELEEMIEMGGSKYKVILEMLKDMFGGPA